MSFDSVLQTILTSCKDARGVSLMGIDGIPIAEVGRDGFDLNLVGVEFGRFLPELQKAADAASGGAVEELIVRASNLWVLLRPVDEDIFLLTVLDGDANFGKARFEMRRHLLALREEL